MVFLINVDNFILKFHFKVHVQWRRLFSPRVHRKCFSILDSQPIICVYTIQGRCIHNTTRFSLAQQYDRNLKLKETHKSKGHLLFTTLQNQQRKAVVLHSRSRDIAIIVMCSRSMSQYAYQGLVVFVGNGVEKSLRAFFINFPVSDYASK